MADPSDEPDVWLPLANGPRHPAAARQDRARLAQIADHGVGDDDQVDLDTMARAVALWARLAVITVPEPELGMRHHFRDVSVGDAFRLIGAFSSYNRSRDPFYLKEFATDVVCLPAANRIELATRLRDMVRSWLAPPRVPGDYLQLRHYLAGITGRHGASEITDPVMGLIATGWRRPGEWDRLLNSQMGETLACELDPVHRSVASDILAQCLHGVSVDRAENRWHALEHLTRLGADQHQEIADIVARIVDAPNPAARESAAHAVQRYAHGPDLALKVLALMVSAPPAIHSLIDGSS